jgi:hypothetical protein
MVNGTIGQVKNLGGYNTYIHGNDEILCRAILNKQKCLFSIKDDKKVNSSCSGVGISEREEDIKKGCRRVNMIEILCTYV